MKLASNLVGRKNTHTTKHQLLEGSRFETANLFNKSLVLITEADQYVGAVNTLKAITGQDELHYEEKMKQAGEGFQFEGMVITAGNEPSRSADYTSGLARRKIAVWFKNHIPSSQRRDLDSEFKAYLPGLLNQILSFSDEDVTRLIRDVEVTCPGLREFQRETLCATNPLADWVDNKVVRSPGTRHSPSYYYKSYKQHLEETGQNAISLNRFSNLLLDLCQNQMNWSDVSKGRDRRLGRYIEGLELRHDGDFSPFPITEGSECVTDSVTLVTHSVTAETTAVNACDACDALLESFPHAEIFTPEKSENFPANQLKNEGLSVTPVTPVTESADAPLESWEEYHARKPYPNPKSDNVRASQKRARAIRDAYRAARTKEDLAALCRENGGEFSFDELCWVTNWLKNFFRAEYNQLQATAKISQPELL
jgi:phage/plasmid-associated DNA primase